MPSSIVFNLLEACREPGCPLCRLEIQSVERYLDNQFYESVNSPRWRDGLRASLGFCHEHAWLGVNKRLGDALGYSIIYRDVIDSLLKHLSDDPSRRRIMLRQRIDKILDVITPRKRCPVCEKRDETRRILINTLVEEMKTPDVAEALRASSGFCLPHLRLILEHVRDIPDCEQIVNIQREKFESLSAELSEFIRKNDYQSIHEGFGKEGDAWLRAVSMIVGRRKDG